MRATIPELAERLRAAYGASAVEPLRDSLAPNDADRAYAVQAVNTAIWLAGGRAIVGYKVGLTSRGVQAQLGVDQPDVGVLFDDMMIEHDGALLPARVLQPRVEGEVALIMGADLAGPDIALSTLEAAVGGVVAAIEIVDSRIAGWKVSFADTVADNASAGFYVLGPDVRPLAGLDLWTCGMVLEVNGEVASVGAGAACLGHPLNAALWLARNLAERGQHLRAGDVVLTGALGPMVSIAGGDRITVAIGGLGSARFVYGQSPG